MQSDIEKVIHASNDDLEACPFCGGYVELASTRWDWGPYDLRYAKFRCIKCGGLFEYAWRSSAHEHVPNAIEWWNTRAPAAPRTCCGYDRERLEAVAALLKENEITPDDLRCICQNIEAGVQIAQMKFTKDLLQQLQEIVKNDHTPQRLI